MIQVILILSIIHYSLFYLYKKNGKSDVLGCGIFGNATKRVNQLEISSFNILGIYNIERGRNSCGVTYDGKLFHGIDGTKIYTDFMKKNVLKPKLTPVIFGHTRSASVGNLVTEENTHPFGFGYNESVFQMCGVHNGTLKNHKELAEKYGIETTVSFQKKYATTEGYYSTTRDKIDSEILLEILWKTKEYNVLKEYVGTAALVWTWPEEPNKVYLWSGASKLDPKDDEAKMFEERPLCVFKKSKNNMFFSSLEESLHSIGATEETSKQINYNTVYCVTDGDFDNATKTIVSRKKSSQNEEVFKRTNNYSSRHPYHGYGDYEEWEDAYDLTGWNATKVTHKEKDKPKVNIFDELENENSTDSKIVYKKLRYWRNGHLISGIHVYITGYGYKFVDSNYDFAIKASENYRGYPFDDGDFLRSTINPSNLPIPFKTTEKVPLYFFVEGVLLRNFLDYNILSARKRENGYKGNFNYSELSYMSRHPVISLNSDGDAKHQGALYEGKLYSGTFSPLGISKTYTFEKGNLSVIKKIDLDKEKEVIQTSLPLIVPATHSAYNKKVADEAYNNIKKWELEYEEGIKNTIGNAKKANAFEQSLEEFDFEEIDEEDEDTEQEIFEQEINEAEFIQETINISFTEISAILNDLEFTLLPCIQNNKAEEAIDGVSEIKDVISKLIK